MFPLSPRCFLAPRNAVQCLHELQRSRMCSAVGSGGRCSATGGGCHLTAAEGNGTGDRGAPRPPSGASPGAALEAAHGPAHMSPRTLLAVP